VDAPTLASARQSRPYCPPPRVQSIQETTTVSESTTVPQDAPARAKPESFRARNMTASLTVKDLEKSVAWWRDVVGCTVDQRYEREGKLRAVSFKMGRVRILLNQDDGAKGWDRTKGAGMSLMFTTAQSVDELAKRIKDAGGTLDSEPADAPWGPRIFRVTDPDGFKFVFSTER
jgi:uncharacterized glyoxalase superfamily protein PhnB